MEKPKSLIINTPFARRRSTGCRGAGGKLEIKARAAAGELRGLRRAQQHPPHRDPRPRQHDPRPRRRMARGGLAGRHHRHPAPAGALARRLGVREYPFYFCQLEAIETLIWWVEGAEEFRQGIAHSGRRRPVGAALQQDGDGRRQDHGDGDDHHLAGAERADLPEADQGFQPRDLHRGAGPHCEGPAAGADPGEGSYYDEFNLCPSEALRQKLNQAEVLIENWHTLMPLREPNGRS